MMIAFIDEWEIMFIETKRHEWLSLFQGHALLYLCLLFKDENITYNNLITRIRNYLYLYLFIK